LDTLKAKPNPVVAYKYRYDPGSSTKVGGLETFFENTDAANCPIQSCEILDSTCEKANKYIKHISIT
jgi:hypothetical protein